MYIQKPVLKWSNYHCSCSKSAIVIAPDNIHVHVHEPPYMQGRSFLFAGTVATSLLSLTEEEQVDQGLLLWRERVRVERL